MRPTQTSSGAMCRSTCFTQCSNCSNDHSLGSVPNTDSSVTGYSGADFGGNVCARRARSLAPSCGDVKSALTSSVRSTKGRNMSSGIAVNELRPDPVVAEGDPCVDCGLRDCWASETSWSAERRGSGAEGRRCSRLCPCSWVGLPDRGPGPEDDAGGAKEVEAKLMRVFSFPVPWLPRRLFAFWEWALNPTCRQCWGEGGCSSSWIGGVGLTRTIVSLHVVVRPGFMLSWR